MGLEWVVLKSLSCGIGVISFFRFFSRALTLASTDHASLFHRGGSVWLRMLEPPARACAVNAGVVCTRQALTKLVLRRL